MDVDTCVTQRRSCRAYTTKRVSWDLIGDILDAGTYAPSAANLQNWTFVVVTDEHKRALIASACAKQTWMNDAPAHIVICNDKEHMTRMFGQRGERYSIHACAMAAQNILLKAHDIGLGACLVGSFDDDAIRRILKIPHTITPELIITVGYPERFEKPTPRTSVYHVTFFDEYGNKKRDDSLFPLSKHAKKLDTAVETKGKKLYNALKNKLKKRQ